ncbi:MAG: MMPL family transporter [Bacilli bacterium]|nr:MMPL family transporter [Bacilli bacterium]
MKKFGDFIVNKSKFILVMAIILLIPSIIGYVKTGINYDILTYLPEDIETLKGEKILTDDFSFGAYSIVITEGMKDKDILKLEDDIRDVETVEKVLSINDLIGMNIPLSIIPEKIKDKVGDEEERLILVIFKNSTSDDKTLNAVERIKHIVGKRALVGGMSTMVLDIKELFNNEMLLYVFIAVILCIVVLELSLDSYLVPFLLISNIGIAIIFNMGSNIIFGSISYITKAIVAILQLGVTTDFSIFLYHKYEYLKDREKNKEEAMSKAICSTFKSVIGSSLTTIAGFLALCTMKLTLGIDIGLVMAKGVLLGVICVLTVFPALLLMFDEAIVKTRHKELLPKFDRVNNFVIKYYKIIFVIFLILLVPAFLAQKKAPVYYKLDESIPDNYDYSMASKKLKEDYNMVTQEIILVNSDMSIYDVNKMTDEILKVDGVDYILSADELAKYGITDDILPDELVDIYKSDKYKMIMVSSSYDIASDELNKQIDNINKIIKSYDKNSILAGEGPLTKDLVNTSAVDFVNVNYTSIVVIFILMLIVLKSISLPVLLVTAVEFAIFLNMGVPYFMGTEIPFIASIVIGTIQLGATIDYAILMTTKYLEERENGKDKVKAIRDTLSLTTGSIFVSAMCFFGATIGVGLISKIDMIGSLCKLISRGAIISMLVVIMLVPSLLIIFDKIIMKTTLLKKKESDKMIKIKKELLILVVGMLLMPLNALALEKEETVYSKMNSDGSLNKVIVNEHFFNKNKDNTLEDLTDLDDVVNINSNNKVSVNDKKLLLESGGSDVFVQGTTNKELPIKEKITYKLDGKDISLDDLLGKSGKVDITIKYTNTNKRLVNVNGKGVDMYTPFVVATVTNFSNKTNSNIEVTNGKVVDNGIGYVVMAISTPGLYENLELKELEDLDTVTITMNTTKFELPSIYSVATPKIMDTSDLDIFSKLDDMYGNIDQLEGAMNDLRTGSNTILTNLNKVSGGSRQISTNMKLVLDNLDKIKSGIVSLDDGLTQIIDSLNSSKDQFGAMNEKLEEMKTLIGANNSYIDGLMNVKNSYEQLSGVPVEYLTPAQQAQIPVLKFTYDNFNLGDEKKSLITVLQGDNVALNETIEAFIKVNDAISSLNIYLPKLKAGADELSNGTSKLKEGVAILNSKMNELSTGSEQLADGMNKFNDGLNQFNTRGIKPILNIKNEAKNMTGKLKAMSSLGEEYQSFSLKNDSTKSKTKFVLITEGKSFSKEVKNTKEEIKKESFFDRLINLFK